MSGSRINGAPPVALENVQQGQAPTVGAERVRTAMRSRFNPIRNLTPELLATHLDSWRAGYIRELALIMDTIEERDDLLTSVIPKRKKAIARLDYEVLTVDESPEAQRHKEALQYFYDNLTASDVLDTDQEGGAELLFKQMMDAVGKRYAVHEIVWEPRTVMSVTPAEDGTKQQVVPDGQRPTAQMTARFNRVPLWFFERTEGRLRYLPGEGSAFGQELEKGQWLVTVGDGLMIPCAIAWMYKRLPLQDWLNYCEKFGMPAVHGKTGAAKDSQEWDDMVELVENFANDLAAVTNLEAQIELIKAEGGTANMPFPGMVERMDRAMTAIWRGGDLSTMSKDGQAVGSQPQDEEGDILLEDDAALISGTLNLKVDKYVIEYLFGREVKPLAYLQIQVPRETDVNREITVDNHLIKHGARLGLNDALERYGRVEAGEGEDVMTAPEPQPVPGGFGNSLPPGLAILANESPADLARLAQAFAQDLQPLRNRIEAILQIEDEAIFRSRLRAFADEMPQLLKDINADPAAAATLEELMGRALLRGAKGETPE